MGAVAPVGRIPRAQGPRASLGRGFTDSAFRGFLLSDSLAARVDALKAALERYRNLDPQRARVLVVIKPDTSSFASTDSAGRIFLYLDPGKTPEQVEEMLARLLRRR